MKRLFLLLTLVGVLVLTRDVQAQCDKACLEQQVNEYRQKVLQLQTQANTLSNQVAQFDAQISLSQLKVAQTQDQIELLANRIDQVQGSLDDLQKAFSARAVATYKMARTNEPAYLVLTSDDLTDAISKYHYLKEAEDSDRELLGRLQSAQDSYIDSKKESEELEKQLQAEQVTLNSQKTAKQQLLVTTQNDEKKYQQLLSKARSELEAIQSIVAGYGEETDAGYVSEGTKIASVISGASACSSGTHLHFEAVQSGVHKNPADYLSNKEVIWDDGPDGPFPFNGSWAWPLNDPVRITQGYGMTYYASTLRYYGGDPHTGIDMANSNGDLNVKAVRNGTLYKGAIKCGGGTLRYVRLKHDDGLDTYYLHVNY